MRKVYTPDEIRKQITKSPNGKLGTAYVTIKFITPVVGGQPATEAGVLAYVTHYLQLTGDDADEAVSRIMKEEVRHDKMTDVTPVDGEVKEEKTYGLNCLRRTDSALPQAYIGTWQIRAMIKQSTSRLGFFSKKIGSKGDLAEGMLILPYGPSKLGGIQEVVLIEAGGQPYVAREYVKFMGSVNSAKGKVSIVHDSEIGPVGSTLSFTVEWPVGKITGDNMAAIIGMAERIGLGSVRSKEHGRFEIVSLEIETPDKVEGEDEPVEEGKPTKGKKGKKGSDVIADEKANAKEDKLALARKTADEAMGADLITNEPPDALRKKANVHPAEILEVGGTRG